MAAWKHWFAAARPKTLPAGIMPVLVGVSLARAAGHFDPLVAGLCLLAAVSVQIAANFANDYYDGLKGTDAGARLGPQRAVQAGLIAPAAMRRAFIGAFAVFAAVGLSLTPRVAWVAPVIVVAAIAGGICYTGGPLPFGYLGLGDLFVFVFFGPVAVCGTYYALTLSLTAPVLIAGAAPGCYSMAMLAINNLRDLDNDRRAGKRTLAVRFGRNFTRWQIVTCIVAAALLPLGLWRWGGCPPGIMLAAVTLPASGPAFRQVFAPPDGPALNRTLAYSGKLMLLYALLFALGVWL